MWSWLHHWPDRQIYFLRVKTKVFEVHHYRQVLVIFAGERPHELLHEVLAFLISRWVIDMTHSLWEPHIIWVINLETITLSFHFLLVMLDKNSEWFEMKNVSFLIRLSMLKTFSLQSYAHNLRLNKIFSVELFSRRNYFRAVQQFPVYIFR